MEVLIAIGAFVVLRVLAGILLAVAARSTRDEPPAPERVDPCLESLMCLPPEPSPEAVLAAGLVSGAIGRDRYRAEMALLAAEDERLHPFVLPPG